MAADLLRSCLQQTSKKMSHMDASFFLPPVGFRHDRERRRCRLSCQVRLQVGWPSPTKPLFGFSESFLNGPNALSDQSCTIGRKSRPHLLQNPNRSLMLLSTSSQTLQRPFCLLLDVPDHNVDQAHRLEELLKAIV